MLVNDVMLVKPAAGKSLDDIGKEWDQIAHLRHKQIASGKDLSSKYILAPAVQELLQGCNLKRVLDLGCGTGELTRELAKVSTAIAGVDLSSLSIDIAQETCAEATNISFHRGSVEVFASQWAGPRFTTVVANMTLMDCLNLDSFVEAAAKLITPKGRFIATITHPWFWPYYWGYANADWFSYHREIVLEAPFRISAEVTDYVTTHVHRPLSSYLNSLSQAGFLVNQILEPHPDEEIQALYPERWEFPRFLAFRASMLDSGRSEESQQALATLPLKPDR